MKTCSCSQCGHQLQVEDTVFSFVCPNCNAKVTLQQSRNTTESTPVYPSYEEAPKTPTKKKNSIKILATVLSVIAVIAAAYVFFFKEKETPVTEKEILVPYWDEESKKYGYCTMDGDVVIEPQFNFAWHFRENGLAIVEIGGKYGFINEKGDIVIEPQFDQAWPFGENGLAIVEINGKWGYINEDGDIVIEPQFDQAYSFGKNDLAPVRIDGKYGYINEDGDWIFEPQFDQAYSFGENGLAQVLIDGKYGLINEKGKIIRPKK